MDNLKRYLGLLWMALGPATILILIVAAIHNIGSGGAGDINRPLPWLIIITVFAPIALGLTLFGWYAWKGEYREEE